MLTIKRSYKVGFSVFYWPLVRKYLPPLGHQFHADKVNQLIHFDFLYIGESSSMDEYIYTHHNFFIAVTAPRHY